LAVLFAIITFVAPGISLAALVLVFGAYALADGVLALISAFRRSGRDAPRWFLVLEGITGIAAGVLTLLWPAISALALLYLIAAWALVSGVLEVVAAIRLRKVVRGEWMLAVAGIASIAFGVLLALFPGPGALALVLWIGAYALVFGILRWPFACAPSARAIARTWNSAALPGRSVPPEGCDRTEAPAQAPAQ
jgi:uncharacterized membrane protein HdeD (DUF308 family)